MKQLRLLISLVLLATLGSCTTLQSNTPARPAALMQVDRDFAREAQTNRVEAWVKYFADDSVHVLADGIATGKEGARKRMTGAYGDPQFSLMWEPIRAEMSRGGNLGYTWGRFKSTRKSDAGGMVTREGNYVTLWEKQKDGSWRIIFDTGDADAPQTVR